MWVLAPGSAQVQPSAQLQPQQKSLYIKLHEWLYGFLKKVMNPLLRLGLNQVFVHTTGSPEQELLISEYYFGPASCMYFP